MPWMVTFTTPQTTYTATVTMPASTRTHLTLEERALSAPVLTGLASGFIAMLAGLIIELQTPPSCLDTIVSSLAIVAGNLAAAAAVVSPVTPPRPIYLFRMAWSVANTINLVPLIIIGAIYPSRREVSPLSILAIFVLELLGLLVVAAAAALSYDDDEEATAVEDVTPAEEVSPVEETTFEDEASPEEPSEEVLTPEQHMQRSREMLERAETLLTNFGVGVHQLHWYVDVLRGTIQEVNSMYPRGWGQRQNDYYDEDYPENGSDSGFLATYRAGLAGQGIYEDPNQHVMDEGGYYDDYPEGEGESGYYDNYVEDEDDNEFYHEDQYMSEAEERAYVEEIEWAGEPAHVVHPEDAESDESTMPDLVADGGMVIV